MSALAPFFVLNHTSQCCSPRHSPRHSQRHSPCHSPRRPLPPPVILPRCLQSLVTLVRHLPLHILPAAVTTLLFTPFPLQTAVHTFSWLPYVAMCRVTAVRVVHRVIPHIVHSHPAAPPHISDALAVTVLPPYYAAMSSGTDRVNTHCAAQHRAVPSLTHCHPTINTMLSPLPHTVQHIGLSCNTNKSYVPQSGCEIWASQTS